MVWFDYRRLPLFFSVQGSAGCSFDLFGSLLGSSWELHRSVLVFSWRVRSCRPWLLWTSRICLRSLSSTVDYLSLIVGLSYLMSLGWRHVSLRRLLDKLCAVHLIMPLLSLRSRVQEPCFSLSLWSRWRLLSRCYVRIVGWFNWMVVWTCVFVLVIEQCFKVCTPVFQDVLFWFW